MNTSIRNNSLTAVIGNKVYTAHSTHPNWSGIMDAVRANDNNGLINAINIRQSVINYVNGNIRIIGNECWYGNLQIGGVVVDRLLNFITAKLPAQPIIKFIDNLYSNPSQRAVTELYSFLEHRNLPNTPEGNFLAYKGLQVDYHSITSGKLTLLQGKTDATGHIYNGIGETIECVRNQVDDNKDNHCSVGIHAGSLEYATSFAGSAGSGGKVVIVEINPRDVVSIPSDCECQKLRTCKYKVVGEYELPLDSTFNDEYSDDDGDEFGDEDVSSDEGYADDDENYDVGYDDGYVDGKTDAEAGKPSDCCLGGETEWTEGYVAGYAAGYVVVKVTEEFQRGYREGLVEGKGDREVGDVNASIGLSAPEDDYERGFDKGYVVGYGK